MSIFEKIIKYYFPAALWAGIIFYLSSISDLKVGAESLYGEVFLRKLGHVFEYIVLVFLVWRVFYHGHRAGVGKAFLCSLLFVAFFAAGDEWHQTFVDDRAGRVIDASVDFLAAAAFLGFLNFFKTDRKKIGWLAVSFLAAAAVCLIIFVLSEQARIKQDSENRDKNQELDLAKKRRADFYESNGPKESRQDFQNKENTADSQEGISSQLSNREDLFKKNSEPELPYSVIANVPFTSQAPYANWDDVHEEACEEASLIMIRYFLSGKELTKDLAELEIQNMKDFQLKNYGTYKDSNMEQLARLAEDFYGIENIRVVYDFSKEEIKEQLSTGNVLILPTAGRKLGNPNFTPPGPLYHNLVAIGYEGNNIITNDPGTRNGEKYVYTLGVLYEAIHDFPGKKEEIETGKKAMIIVSH